MASPAAAADDPAPLIVGGHDAAEPYSFMISLQNGGSHSCGASLIKWRRRWCPVWYIDLPAWAVHTTRCLKAPKDIDWRP